MKEGGNVSQYVNQIKYVLSEIRVSISTIQNSKIVSKVLRTLLPVYAIKISSIQEVRAMPGNDLILDGLVGQLTAFELRNYDNIVVTIGNTFKSLLTIKNTKKEKKTKE